MSKQPEVETDEPAVVNYRKKWDRKRRKGAVPLKHLDNPPHRMRRFLAWMLLAVVLFWFLHFVMKIG